MSSSVRRHRLQPTRIPHPWDSLGKNTGVGCHFLLQCMKVKSQSEVTDRGVINKYMIEMVPHATGLCEISQGNKRGLRGHQPRAHQHVSTAERGKERDFPDDPMAKTLRSQCRGPRFDPWSENQILHATTKEPTCHS